MQLDIEPKHIDRIEPTSVLTQTSFWARVKQKQGFTPRAFDIKVRPQDLKVKKNTDKKIAHATDDILILIHRLNTDQYMAYIPYGPVLEPKEELQGVYLEELSETVRGYLPDNCLFIRYDLRWESPWSADNSRFSEDNKWLGPPDAVIQEMRINFCTNRRKLRKSVTDNLPSNTIFLNLEEEPEKLLKKMKPKTRYNIRLSTRKGVTVRKVEADALDLWYGLYKQTAMRNGIFLHDFDYFKYVFDAQNEHSKSPADVRLLLAESKGEALAGMFLIKSGRRATYLYGASSDLNRNYMAAYALQWEAIKRARKAGCTEYDMFGVSPTVNTSHPLYGLYRFKSGFGGDMVHRMGCWDYPLYEKEYELYRFVEMNSQGYHIRGS